MKNTNHDKNLDYIYDNHPELLDDYIDIYENSIFAVDHTVSPENMIDITEMIIAFEKEKRILEANGFIENDVLTRKGNSAIKRHISVINNH